MSQPDYLISTPENVDLHLELAGIGNRVYACLVDSLLSFALGVLVGLACILVVGAVGHMPLPANARSWIVLAVVGLTILVELAIYFGYYIFFEGSWQGQTPGKRLAQIRVIESNGQPASLPSVCIRNLLRVVDVGVVLVGLIIMLADRNERRLGDLAAGTLVIRERHSPKLASLNIAASPSNGTLIDAGRLTPPEYDLLVSFLDRREKLSPAHRPLLARNLENYFRKRLQQQSQGESSELFLEQLYLAYRSRAE